MSFAVSGLCHSEAQTSDYQRVCCVTSLLRKCKILFNFWETAQKCLRYSDNIVKPIYHSDTPSDTTKPLKINKLRFKVTQRSDTSERDSEYWLQIWWMVAAWCSLRLSFNVFILNRDLSTSMITVFLEIFDIDKFPCPLAVFVLARLQPKVTGNFEAFIADNFPEPSAIE